MLGFISSGTVGRIQIHGELEEFGVDLSAARMQTAVTEEKRSHPVKNRMWDIPQPIRRRKFQWAAQVPKDTPPFRAREKRAKPALLPVPSENTIMFLIGSVYGNR
ncbi:MAG: hypothetical protein V4726_12335 [Verrucomicrobiota bacterium]